MNYRTRCLTVCLMLAATLVCLADEKQQGSAPRISFEGLEAGSAKGVPILGTFFRTRKGDYLNFIPVEPNAKGVWTRSLSAEVKQAALEQIAPSRHVPVIVLCDITVQPANRPARPPGVSTGAYFGPMNVAHVTSAKYLTKEAATQKAKELVKDETQRTRFLARFK